MMANNSDDQMSTIENSNITFSSLTQDQLQAEMEYDESIDNEELADPNHAVLLPNFKRVNNHNAPSVSVF